MSLPARDEIPDFDAMLAKSSGPSAAPAAGPAARPGESTRNYRTAVLLIAVILGFLSIRSHWTPNKWLFGDGAFYMNVVRGLLDDGSLRQESLHPHSWYDRDLGWNRNVDAAWSNIALGRNGEWWPKHPILMPIVASPFVWAFGPIGTLIFQFLAYVLMALLAWRVATRVAPRPAALAATIAFLATPWIHDRVWGFNNDVFYTVLILAALDATLSGKAPVLAGVLLGVGVFAKATNVLYGPALLAVFLLRKDLRGALRFCVAAAVPAALYLGLNWYMYGSPFHTGYDRILVREAGVLGMHSHSADFHFSQVLPGLKKVLFGGETFLGRFPLFFAALAGLVPLAIKRPREALLFAWCIAVPVAFHAPYTWYRLEFNLPQIAIAVAPLAALLAPLGAPFEEDFQRKQLRWGRLVLLVLGVVLLGAGLGRRALAEDRSWFQEHLTRASVRLGDMPCDYFNNQVERWECSHFDNNDWFMTGRVLKDPLKFEGKAEDLLVLHPHPSGKERVLEYSGVPLGDTLKVRYGLADNARANAQVRFQVLVDGQPLLEEEVTGKGLREKALDTSAFAGREAKVAFVTRAANANWCIFGVDAGL